MSFHMKKLITRHHANTESIEFIQNCINSDDETSKHFFHKIMVHNWIHSDTQLYDVMSEYFGSTFIPINFSTQNLVTTFYTSNFLLVMKIINLDFVFPFNRNMYNLDVLLNDKTSFELFDKKITLEDTICEIVNRRINANFEFDLSNFCNDREFEEKKIHFYKLSLLSSYRLLMLRVGRETKMLNLSNNKLSEVPQDIMNFFIKGNLYGVNLSNNNIPSIMALHRMNSKIEKLWIEGNPLCEDMSESDYIKEVMKKFPRLVELDGIKINNHGITLPFHKHYLPNDDGRTQCLVEQFVTTYFSHYDSESARNVAMFYHTDVQFTLSSNLNEIEKVSLPKIAMYSRNLTKQNKCGMSRVYRSRGCVMGLLTSLPRGHHDLTTFRVDVLQHAGNTIIFVIDGLFKDLSERYYSFRRTFILKCKAPEGQYFIINEMFTISIVSKDMKNSFKGPTRHKGELMLINPTSEEQEIIIKLFKSLTQLKKSEAEKRLKKHVWDIRHCLAEFYMELKSKRIDDDQISTDDEASYMDVLDEVD